MAQSMTPPGWITSAEAGALMRIHLSYLNRLVQRGKLVPIKVGHARLFRREEVVAYIRTHPHLGTRRTTHA